MTLDLCASTYDTSVLIYTGTSGNLTFVAGNDDNDAPAPGGCGACCQSKLTFAADGTSTYYITVEGWNVGSVGDFEMVVSCVPLTPAPDNDDCADAEALTFGNTVPGTTVGATTSAGDSPTCDPFGSIADVWYSVNITGGTSDLSVTTTIPGGSTADFANVAVYDDCAALNANSLGCSNETVGGETLLVTDLAVGTYYIRVWNDGNAVRLANPNLARTEGDFEVVADVTLSTIDFENGNAFTYYPNPVKNTLTFNAQNNIESIVVYNILGQEVVRTVPNNVNANVDMNSLADGSYFVKVSINGTTETVRIIKR